MASNVKYASIFVGTLKIGDMQKNTFELDTGDGQEMTDAGAVFTDGITTAKVTCEALVPKAGMKSKILPSALKKEDVTLRVGILDGTIYTMSARLKTAKVDSEVASGKQVGNFEWMCHDVKKAS